MRALDEICFIEQQIHDLVRASQEYEGRAVRARMEIKKLQTTRDNAKKDREFHEKNINHVRGSDLPHVVLEDFAKTKRLFAKADTAYENAAIGILQAEAAIARCQEEVAGNDRRIGAMRTKLAEYGQIIEFPTKKES